MGQCEGEGSPVGLRCEGKRLSVCRGKVPAGHSCGSEEAQGLPQPAASTQLLPAALAAVPKGHCLSP